MRIIDNFTKFNINTLNRMVWEKQKTATDENGERFTIYRAAMRPNLFKTVWESGYIQYAWN